MLSATQVANHYTAGTNLSPPPPVQAQLSISRSGTGTGTVTSAPRGITCGAACSASFASGTSITLTATPTAGSILTGWTGGGCSGTGTCKLSLNANTTVSANFSAIPARMLTVTRSGTGDGTVTSAPGGITCLPTCSASFATGKIVTLTATTTAGSRFTGWSGGGCTGTRTCTLTLGANTSVDADFARGPTATLKVSRRGYGTVRSSPAGILCGSDCSASFTAGTSVRLNAAARTGWIFAGWSGGTCRGRAACRLTMRLGMTAIATFERRPFAHHTAVHANSAPAQARTLSLGGEKPAAVALDTGLQRAYVTRIAGRGVAAKYGVSVIDTSSWRVIAQITTGGSVLNPSSIAVNPVTHLVYVTTAVFDPGSVRGSITVIDGRTNKVVRSIATGPGPKAIAVNATTNRVYVTEQTGSDGAEAIAVIDGFSSKVIATIPIGPYDRFYNNPFGLAVDPNTNTVYATNPLQGTVYTIDATTSTVVRSVALGGEPTALATDLPTNTIYVTGARTITALSAQSGAVLNSITIGSRPRGITVDASHHLLYTTTDDGDILALGTEAFGSPRGIAHGAAPYGGAVNAATGLFVVAISQSNTVSVFAYKRTVTEPH